MSGRSGTVAAVDLGATSGRVVLGGVSQDRVELEVVARFRNDPVQLRDGLHWNILELLRRVQAGIRVAGERENSLLSVGIDAWGVDYGLLRRGSLVGLPFHYRDGRNLASSERVLQKVDAAWLYQRSGIQHMAINTLFQLAADVDTGLLEVADKVILTPDLVGYWLTGHLYAEQTIAATTGLVHAGTRAWDTHLMRTLGYPPSLFPELVEPGEVLAPLTEELGLPGSVVLTSVGAHDTASAIVGIPATTDDFAYISCGTWGLIGVELDRPLLDGGSRDARFTNEAGVDRTVLFQRNSMGLWLLSEAIRSWEATGGPVELSELLQAAAAVSQPAHIFDVDDPQFSTPGDMPTRIQQWFSQRGQRPPANRAETARTIIESLAQAFADGVHKAAALSGKSVTVVHLVGGGCQNDLLCQAVADRVGLPVLAGPVEATATGNVLVQARTHGMVSGSIPALRAVVARAHPPRTFRPRPPTAQ
jgi:rhamnulokinase